MTEPIAVDVPGKPAFPRSAPLPVPGAASVPASAKPEAPKSASSPAPASKPAVTLPPIAALPPLPPTVKPTVGWLARFTRKQLLIGVTALLSTGAGIGGLRLAFPLKEADKPTQTADNAKYWDDKKQQTPSGSPPPGATPTPTQKGPNDLPPVVIPDPSLAPAAPVPPPKEELLSPPAGPGYLALA